MDGVQWAAIDAFVSGTSPNRTDIQIFDLPHHQKVADLISHLLAPGKPSRHELPHGATLQTLHQLSRVQYQMRIACCAGGRLALGPDLTEVGDSIAVLHGSRTPVVLQARRDGTFRVVGQCYYDGGMYGELADEDDDGACVVKLV